MKNYNIAENEIGIVYKKNDIVKIITPGNYWFFWGEKIEIHSTLEAFPEVKPGIYNNSLLKNFIEIIEVADDELLLLSKNKNFKTVLTSGTYAFWKNKHAFSFQKVTIKDYKITDVSQSILAKPEINFYVRNYKIESFEKGLLFVDGEFIQILEPGNYYWWKNAQNIIVIKGDIRVQTLEILGQEILTKDKVQLRLNFAIQYKINDFIKAYVDTKETDKQLYVLLQMALRTLVGGLTFDDLMDQKSKIAEIVMTEILEKSARLGIQIIDAGLKDVILPGEIREIMNQVLIAEKTAQANSIMRREETASTRSLLNTAKLMEENQMLYKLKEMEYIEKIAEKINSISVSGSNNVVTELKQIFTK